MVLWRDGPLIKLLERFVAVCLRLTVIAKKTSNHVARKAMRIVSIRSLFGRNGTQIIHVAVASHSISHFDP